MKKIRSYWLLSTSTNEQELQTFLDTLKPNALTVIYPLAESKYLSTPRTNFFPPSVLGRK